MRSWSSFSEYTEERTSLRLTVETSTSETASDGVGLKVAGRRRGGGGLWVLKFGDEHENTIL